MISASFIIVLLQSFIIPVFSFILSLLSTLFVLTVFAGLIRYGVKILKDYKKLKEEGIAVAGTVIGQHVEGKGEKNYYQIIRFLTEENEEIICKHKYEGSMAEKGQQVMVYYSPECPTNFVVKSRGIRFNAFVTIFIGAIALIGIVIYIIYHHKLLSFFS